jgi:hypothetical protein
VIGRTPTEQQMGWFRDGYHRGQWQLTLPNGPGPGLSQRNGHDGAFNVDSGAGGVRVRP